MNKGILKEATISAHGATNNLLVGDLRASIGGSGGGGTFSSMPNF